MNSNIRKERRFHRDEMEMFDKFVEERKVDSLKPENTEWIKY